MAKYNTNLAAEFYELSMLHCLGTDASLTLGNKKPVDIFVVGANGETKTVDVKGLVDPYDWPADIIQLPDRENHFVALLSFEKRIADPQHAPRVWTIRAKLLADFIIPYGTRTVVSRKLIKEKGDPYLHAWASLLPSPAGCDHAQFLGNEP